MKIRTSKLKGESFGRFLKFLYKEQEIYGYIPQGKFIDIGSLEDYKKANKVCIGW